MATKKITISLPEELVESARALTGNLSGYAAEALARQIRHDLLGQDLQKYQEEHGQFSEEETALARARLHGQTASDSAA